jgi:hypothetical protein
MLNGFRGSRRLVRPGGLRTGIAPPRAAQGALAEEGFAQSGVGQASRTPTTHVRDAIKGLSTREQTRPANKPARYEHAVCLSYATCHAVALCSARRVVYDTSNGRRCPCGNKRELRAAMVQVGAAHATGLCSYAPRR